MWRWPERLTRRGLPGAVLRIDAAGLGWQGQAQALAWEGAGPDSETAWAEALVRAAAAAPADAARGVTLSIADAWCRWWAVEPPAALHRLDDLQALAEARLAAVFGLAPGAWVVACAAPPLRALWRAAPLAVAACAVPVPLLAALRHCAQTQAWPLQAVAAQSAAPLAAWLRGPAASHGAQWWVGLAPGHAVCALAEQGQLRLLQPCWHQGAWSAADLVGALSRVALGAGTAPPRQVRLALLDAPARVADPAWLAQCPGGRWSPAMQG